MVVYFVSSSVAHPLDGNPKYANPDQTTLSVAVISVALQTMLSKAFVAALCAGLAVAKQPQILDLGNYTFEQYMTDFQLKFHPSEIEYRKNNFAAEVARVQAHNAKNLSWKEGINKFSVLSAKEKKAYNGRSKGAAHKQKSMLKNAHDLPANFEMKPISALPKQVDWRDRGIIFFALT